MLDWLTDHIDVLGLAISFCTLLVWVVYAQLLFAGFRRQRQPSLMINRGYGDGLDARCIIANMSAEGIYIQYVIAELETAEGTTRMDITDRRPSSDATDDERNPTGEQPTFSALSDLTHQGPLPSNDTFQLGSFRHLLERLGLEGYPGEPSRVRSADEASLNTGAQLTVRLIASYGPEDRPVGAERTFRIASSNGQSVLIPDRWYTRQLSSRSQRHGLQGQIREIHRREIESTSPAD